MAGICIVLALIPRRWRDASDQGVQPEYSNLCVQFSKIRHNLINFVKFIANFN